jgi:hypothetical protein
MTHFRTTGGPSKNFLGATDLVSGDRSATMLKWQRLDGHIKGEADVVR